MFELQEALHYIVRKEGSDLHLKVGSRPIARIHGRLEPIEEYDLIHPEDTERVLKDMLVDPDKLAEFDDQNEVDFAYAVEGLARFRVNAFRQRGSISIVARLIPFAVRTLDELGLPAVMAELADEERGLILLTGTTGSGKSTTLAAMIDQINDTKPRHIVTIEDPIEYMHTDRTSIINQREVGMDTESFKRAMRRVLRQDPDVILIGEMRDEETVRSALSAPRPATSCSRPCTRSMPQRRSTGSSTSSRCTNRVRPGRCWRARSRALSLSAWSPRRSATVASPYARSSA